MHTLIYLFLLQIAIITPAICYCLPKEESEQIVIRLATENQLIPVYLGKLSDDNSGLSSTYLKQLEEVLQFDLNHNGMTYTVAQNSENEKLISLLSIDSMTSMQPWRAINIYYAIKIKMTKDKSLETTLFAVNGDSIKQIKGLSMTGDLSQDRTTIHHLADAIHKTLFGSDGIASTHVLYSVRKKIPGNNKWTAEIWEADYDGGNPRRVIHDSGYNINPVYVTPKPGHKAGSLFYVGYQSAQPKIFIASLKEGTGRRLTTLRGNQLMPAVTRQRDKVAFISDVTGNPDLFLQAFHPESGAQGKPQQIFSGKKATQGTPTFSPSGDQIAFVSNKDGSPRIYVIDVPAPETPLKNINAKLVTKHSKESSAPTWSPDGTKLAYCAITNGARQIWIYDFNTKEERQLTQGSGHKENPTWAPNSLNLIYNCSNGEECELYLINLNQPKATRITSGPGEKRFPNWEPHPH